MYALLVLIAVVDKPPCRVVNPLAVSVAILVAPVVIVKEPPAIFEVTAKLPVLVSPLTLRAVIYALFVLIAVVDIPPSALSNPPTLKEP